MLGGADTKPPISQIQAFHHDVTVPRICPGSDQIFDKYQGLDPGHDLVVSPRSRSRILRICWLNIHGNTTDIRSGDPRYSWYPGYRNIFPHHVNTTEEEDKSLKIKLYVVLILHLRYCRSPVQSSLRLGRQGNQSKPAHPPQTHPS